VKVTPNLLAPINSDPPPPPSSVVLDCVYDFRIRELEQGNECIQIDASVTEYREGWLSRSFRRTYTLREFIIAPFVLDKKYLTVTQEVVSTLESLHRDAEDLRELKQLPFVGSVVEWCCYLFLK